MTPTDAEKTIIDSANSLIELEIIALKKKKAKKSKADKSNGETAEAVNGDANGDAAVTNGDSKTAELEPEDKEKPAPPTSEVPVDEIAAN